MRTNGLFISKLSYLICLWGGCSGQLRKKIQVVQNRAARLVAKCDWSVPLKDVYRQIGWLSVKQLVFYHTVLLIFKTRQEKSPKYIHDMFSSKFGYHTRQAERGAIQLLGRPKLDLTQSSFKWRGAKQFNDLPAEIRLTPGLTAFKSKVKAWNKGNVDFALNEQENHVHSLS